MKKRDIAIGVVTGLSWPEIRPYAVSLTHCGFQGDKVLLVNNIADDARANLTKLGFILEDFELSAQLGDCRVENNAPAWTFFGKYRYWPVIAYLQDSLDKYRYVIWTDVRDVLFQCDPAEWLEANLEEPYKIVGAKEGWQIKNQPHNDQWAVFTAPESDYVWLREQEVLCAGTIVGEAAAMVDLFKALFTFSETSDPRANDQGIFNYIVRKEPFRDITMVPHMDAGFIATAWNRKNFQQHAFSTDDAPRFNLEDYVVYTPQSGQPFAIVHQYDRDGDWRHCIERIMETAYEHL